VHGGLAEYCRLRAHQLIAIPDGVGYADAAALPCVYVNRAWLSLPNGESASGDTDSPTEEAGFEPSVPRKIGDALETALFASAAPPVPPERPLVARGTGSSNPLSSANESVSPHEFHGCGRTTP
jgi:hypothetical protein